MKTPSEASARFPWEECRARKLVWCWWWKEIQVLCWKMESEWIQKKPRENQKNERRTTGLFHILSCVDLGLVACCLAWLKNDDLKLQSVRRTRCFLVHSSSVHYWNSTWKDVLARLLRFKWFLIDTRNQSWSLPSEESSDIVHNHLWQLQKVG